MTYDMGHFHFTEDLQRACKKKESLLKVLIDTDTDRAYGGQHSIKHSYLSKVPLRYLPLIEYS